MRSSGENVPSVTPWELAPKLPSPSVCASESTLSCNTESRGYEKKADGSVEVVKSCVKSSRPSACDVTVRAHSYAHADRNSDPDSAMAVTLATMPICELDLKMGSPSPQCSTAHVIANRPSTSASGASNASGEKTRIGSPKIGGNPGGNGATGGSGDGGGVGGVGGDGGGGFRWPQFIVSNVSTNTWA